MTTNNEAFEKWFSNKLAECRANNDMDMHRNLSRYVGFYKFGFEEATTEANKRVAELESEVAELKGEKVRHDQLVDYLKAGIAEELEQLILELKASNNRLREALHKAQLKLTYGSDEYNLAENALLYKPAESLQAHDNEVLERAASIVQNKIGSTDEAPLSDAVAEILALKTEVTK